jgi:hypothetical protein
MLVELVEYVVVSLEVVVLDCRELGRFLEGNLAKKENKFEQKKDVICKLPKVHGPIGRRNFEILDRNRQCCLRLTEKYNKNYLKVTCSSLKSLLNLQSICLETCDLRRSLASQADKRTMIIDLEACVTSFIREDHKAFFKKITVCSEFTIECSVFNRT